MKKRGQLSFKALASIIASAIIVLFFIQLGKNYGSQDTYYKLAIAKDLALTFDLIYAYSGDIDIMYPNDLSAYDVELRDNVVKIYSNEQGKTDPAPQSYRFVNVGKQPLDVEIKAKKFLKIEKINENIRVTGVDQTNPPERSGNYGGAEASGGFG